MNKRRIVWLCITIGIAVFFTTIIPVDTFDRYDMLLGFLGGALFAVALGQTIGDFDSIYELFEEGQMSSEKKLALFAIIPGIIFVIVSIFHNLNRKEKELEHFGLLTKGTIVNGSSTTTTRRFRSNTTYELIVSYLDSAGQKHIFKESVNSGEFSDAYQGAAVDVIYSKKHPALAKAVFGVDELVKFTKVPNEAITINHLIAILESSKQDTILNYLNNISYVWTQPNPDVFTNDKRSIAIKVFPDSHEIAFMQNSDFGKPGKDSFEGKLESFGFRKKAFNENGETHELYYNDKYSVTKESKMSERSPDQIGISMYTIYHVIANDTQP